MLKYKIVHKDFIYTHKVFPIVREMQNRLTKIICTIGPACATVDQLRALAETGMNVARINMSHGARADHKKLIDAVKTVNKEGFCIGILFDTKGAEIRTSDIPSPLVIEEGEEVFFVPPSLTLTTDKKVVVVNYDKFSNDVRGTNSILVDNGELSFDIVSIEKDGSVLAKARESGSIGSRRHVNLPGADLDMPSVTDQDWNDLDFAIEEEADFIALSFIRTGEEVKEVRAYLDKKKSPMRIVTKVETAHAVKNITEIIEASDGIMVARGDLGAEIPYEQLPAIQDQIVTLCSDANKPVIVATHMLESMRDHPIPTRAEMTDVAHAATTFVDSTMLSAETASGKHPRKALEAMSRLLLTTEQYVKRFRGLEDIIIHDEYEARAEAAVNLASTTDTVAIVVFTRTGKTAQQLSKFRPGVPIVACTEDIAVQRSMTLLYGVIPLLVPSGAAEEMFKRGLEAAKNCGAGKSGDKVILVSDIPKGTTEWYIQLRYLP